ncbi:MAG: carbohydrate ABC transporter permease [Candidatus Gastranaerophilales bacterium]|nr:carbohydrate ABC transporter permease [Candidatus Gastranaerophilales bacterium]
MCLLSIVPLLWLLSTALKGRSENIFAYPPVFLPQDFTLDNFKEVLKLVPIIKYVINSFIVAFFTVVLNVILSALAAYPLARMNFKGKKIAFFAILSTIMVPFQTIMLPVYIITLKLHLVDSYSDTMGYLGLILPFAVNAFGIFLMRQAFMTISREVEESAVVDGCNSFQIFSLILLPMVKPTIALLAIFTFIGSWGEFLWPSIVLTNDNLFTLPVGINNLSGAFSADYRLVAAGSIISIVPILIFFIALQKYFIQGSQDGAVKG